MAKARAIVKRRKAVRNIRKITKTMQMIATAKFQKSLKRAVGTKPYTLKIRELVQELAASVGNVEHPLLRKPTEKTRTNKIAVVVLTSNRGLAGAYNGSVLRAANHFIKEQEAAGKTIELYLSGKKGISYFNYQKRAIARKYDQFGDNPKYQDVNEAADFFIQQFVDGQIDGLAVAYMNFISTGSQKPNVMRLLPLASADEAAVHSGRQSAEAEAQDLVGMHNTKHLGENIKYDDHTPGATVYEFSPGAKELLDELLPLTVKAALFQAFMDAVTSEHVARMVSMKSATDNAEEMAKALTMQYNRARQSQITTELSEIMGGVEAMKG
jgi:F-type H+-transporting ATPase subunit gamma